MRFKHSTSRQKSVGAYPHPRAQRTFLPPPRPKVGADYLRGQNGVARSQSEPYLTPSPSPSLFFSPCSGTNVRRLPRRRRPTSVGAYITPPSSPFSPNLCRETTVRGLTRIIPSREGGESLSIPVFSLPPFSKAGPMPPQPLRAGVARNDRTAFLLFPVRLL